MAALPDLSVKFTADTAGFTAATQNMTRSVEGMRRSMETHLGAMQSRVASFTRGMVGAFTLERVVQGLIQLGTATVGWAADLDEAAASVGLTSAQLQQFQVVAAASGASSEQLSQAIGRLTETLGEAALGSDEAIKKFADAGIAIRDAGGHIRPTADIFEDLIARLAAIEDPATRAALGTALLGRTYRNLAPMIEQGVEAFRRARAEAPLLAAEWSQRADELMQRFTDVNTAIRTQLAPAFIWFGERVADIFSTTVEAASELIRIIDTIAAQAGLGSLSANLQVAEQDFQRVSAAAAAAQANLERLRAEPGVAASTITLWENMVALLRQGADNAQAIRNEAAAAAEGARPAPGPAATTGGAITRGGNQAAREAARQAERDAEARAKAHDKEIAEANQTIASLDRIRGATQDYQTALTRLTFARHEDMISAEENTRLRTLAVEQYRDEVLGSVGLTDAYDNQAAAAERLRERTEALGRLRQRDAISLEDYTRLMRRATAEAALGAEGWKDFTRATEGVGSAITSSLEAAILRAESFRDVLKGLVEELRKVLLQELLLAPLRRLISGGLQAAGSWAFGTSTAPVGGGIAHGAQAGAIIDRPTLLEVGEGAHTEAIVPMPNGRSIPVSLKGDTGGTQATAVFNIDARNADVGVERRVMAVLRAYEPGLVARLMDAAGRGGAFAKAFGRA